MQRPPDGAIAAAWYAPAQLDAIAREERQAVEYRLAVRRRDLFEARVAEAGEPLSKDQLRAMWAQADSEARGD